MPKPLLRLEGLIVFLAALYAYYLIDGNWVVFLLLFLIADIFMIGYLLDKRKGAITYNIIHTYIVAIPITAVGFYLQNSLIMTLGIILTAHIGLDRSLGYGLKYPTDFKDTHMQRM